MRGLGCRWCVAVWGLLGCSDIFWFVAFFVGQVSVAWCSSAAAYLQEPFLVRS